MNWRKLTLLVLLPLTMLSGCQTQEKYEETIHDRIHKNFSDIASYKASCTITVHAQKDHVYNAKMTYSKKDGSLRLAYDNIAITLSGADAEITKDGVSLKTKSADTYMPIFINTFFKYYYAGEESSMDVSGVHSFGTTTLETSLSQSDTNAAGQRLWIDNETALPVKSEILKSDGTIYMEIIYKSFKFTKE